MIGEKRPHLILGPGNPRQAAGPREIGQCSFEIGRHLW